MSTDFRTPSAPPSSQRLSDITPPNDGPIAKRRGRRTTWLFAVLVVLLIPLITQWGPREISNWYYAAALEKHLNGNVETAMDILNDAIEWAPDHVELHVRRALWKLDLKDFEGSLLDATTAVETETHSTAGYSTRSLVHQRMGQHEAAVRDQDQIVKFYRDKGDALLLAQALNNRAYFRALGKIELESGLADVQQAIKLEQNETGRESAFYLDTRGYLFYLLDNVDAALRDLIRATDLSKRDRESAKKALESQITSHRERDMILSEIDQNLAVVYHHLGLAYQKNQESELAEKYLKLGDDLGYNPAKGVW